VYSNALFNDIPTINTAYHLSNIQYSIQKD
jgi:hypothetical protein